MVHLPTALFSLSYIRDSSNRCSHYAPCGARRQSDCHSPTDGRYFNPRAPCGARRQMYRSRWSSCSFQSTRPARGATIEKLADMLETDISIHAPREGRDFYCLYTVGLMYYFNPRAPRGARPVFSFSVYPRRGFQSTRPARGATGYPTTTWLLYYRLFQSTRPARGATKPVFSLFEMRTISIHAPREGRDLHEAAEHVVPHVFQSTRPARGATPCTTGATSAAGFQSTRPARGATHSSRLGCACSSSFQSTRPARGATCRENQACPCQPYFNPRAPRGARRHLLHRRQQTTLFQSTRPARGATSVS